jgi:hypothetical protein
MQKLMLIAVPMIILAAAVYITHSIDTGSHNQPNGPIIFNMLEDNGSSSSPIIVGDGSIHVRQYENLIHELDGNHAYISMDQHTAIQVTDGSCQNKNTPSADCTITNSPTPLFAPWTIQLNDKNGKSLGTLGTPDGNFPGLILFSTADANHTIVGREPDKHDSHGKRGDGGGFLECSQDASNCSANATFYSAAVIANGSPGATPSLCQSLPSGSDGNPHCILKIAYCTPGAVSDKSCFK